MGTNYYRGPKMKPETVQELKIIADTSFSVRELNRRLRKFTEENCREVHVGKSSMGWKFHWAAEVLLAILDEHPEIAERPLPETADDFLHYFRNHETGGVLPHPSDDMKKVTRADIEKWLEEGDLFNEYGEKVRPDTFWETVRSKEDGMDSEEYVEKHPDESRWYTTPRQVYVDGLFFDAMVTDWC